MANIIVAPGGGSRSSSDNGGFLAAVVLLTLIAGAAGAGLAAFVYQYSEDEVRGRMRFQQTFAETLPFSTSARVQQLEPIVTNLAAPKDAWIRLQASVLLDKDAKVDIGIIRKKVEDDFLAYMRTVTLSHLEGGSGLQHLREDLTERARTRTKGQVQEVMLESVVIQ
ncbi:flagellar basal body-associated FliL family protein [Roseibium aggregatum]|uniref:Flagellar protein FliL n=1 Tax=Roseibium aggregatum TaxID=187304 RepID=A0A939EFS2_9HYPH|nr:flagellar basal body-associated FliL family protein [Roseibium aggregatum]MBN9670734.1 flagellar basal body-associated FliL family protein [Roseibium aggregatum]